MSQDTVEHKVGKRYQIYLRSERQGTATPEDIPLAPYGRHYGPDPKDWDPQTREFRPGYKSYRAIQGPANWSQIWPDFTQIGTDYNQQIHENQPLLRNQLVYAKKVGNEMFGKIKFIRVLGEGGFGRVWLIKVRKVITVDDQGIPTRKKVYEYMACKVLSLQNSGGTPLQKAVDDMLADMRSHPNLEHTNIVAFKGFITIPDCQTGFPFARTLIFMDLCDESLRDIMDQNLNGYPEHSCRQWVRGIAEGLQYLHDNRVVHLDVKPANILVKWNRKHTVYVPKLADFGFSIVFLKDEPMRLTGGYFAGTPAYMAPEMNGSVDYWAKPCDVYSLDMSLAESLIGTTRFDSLGADEIRAILWNIASGSDARVQGLQAISADMAELCYSMIFNTSYGRLDINQVITHSVFE